MMSSMWSDSGSHFTRNIKVFGPGTGMPSAFSRSVDPLALESNYS